MIKVDSRGRLLYSKDRHNNEIYFEYDDRGNTVYHKNHKGYEWWREYDHMGRETHYRGSSGYTVNTSYEYNCVTCQYFSKGVVIVTKRDYDFNVLSVSKSIGGYPAC